MRNFRIIVSIILLVLILIFSFQNMGLMVIKLFNWSIELPKAVVIILTYVFGMMTGGLVFGLLRSLVPPLEEKGKERVERRGDNI